MCADCHLPGTLCMWTDCTTCFEGCATTAGECGGCLGGAGEAGLPLLLIMGVIVLGLFTVVGIFYSVLVATMVGQRIWQRHYHILAKRMLTKVSISLHSSFRTYRSWCFLLFITPIWCSPGICCGRCWRWTHRLVSATAPCWACPAAQVPGTPIAHAIELMAVDDDLSSGPARRDTAPAVQEANTKLMAGRFLYPHFRSPTWRVIPSVFFVHCNRENDNTLILYKWVVYSTELRSCMSCIKATAFSDSSCCSSQSFYLFILLIYPIFKYIKLAI
jgi:hypothetical protein